MHADTRCREHIVATVARMLYVSTAWVGLRNDAKRRKVGGFLKRGGLISLDDANWAT